MAQIYVHGDSLKVSLPAHTCPPGEARFEHSSPTGHWDLAEHFKLGEKIPFYGRSLLCFILFCFLRRSLNYRYFGKLQLEEISCLK